MFTHSIYGMLIQLCWAALMGVWSISRGAPWQNLPYFFCLLASFVGIISLNRLKAMTIGLMQILLGMSVAMLSINEPSKVWLCSFLISCFGGGCLIISRKSETIINVFEKHKKIFMVLAAIVSVLIYMTLLFFATPKNGVRAWLSFGNETIQLTEIQKYLSAFLTGCILEHYKKDELKKLVLTLGNILFHVICLVLICNELGTALIILMSNLIVLLISQSGRYRARMLMAMGCGMVCLVGAYNLGVSFQDILPENLNMILGKLQTRVMVFMDPSKDRFGKGYQAYMSLSTIGAAGWFGLPLEKIMCLNIPNLKNDYAFTSLILHGGLISGILYFVAITGLVYAMLRESISKHNRICIVMILHIWVQAVVGILGAVNLIPFSGIGLPFIGSGYSAYSVMLLSLLTILLFNSDKRRIRDISMNAVSKFSITIMAVGLVLVLIVSSSMCTNMGSKFATEMEASLSRKISVPGTVVDTNDYIISTADEENNTTMISHPSAYSWLVGYSDKIHGNSGLYSKFEKYLLNENSENVKMKLTLDSGLQEFCYNLLEGISGSVTILENETGRILCLASRDSRLEYDVNNLAATLEKANEFEGYLLGNGFTENEAPGSVFKLITSVAALESEEIEKEELIYYDTGEYVSRTNYKVHNYGGYSYGSTDLEKALVKSVNTYFGYLSDRIGGRMLKETAEKFAFNKEIVTDFTVIHPSLQIKNMTELTSTGFGQGSLQTCPLHIAMWGAALGSSDGAMRIPYVVDKVVNEQKTLYLAKEQTIVKSVCDNAVRQELLNHLQKVSVSYGLADDQEQIYSKTGTAELGNGLNHAYLLTFDTEHTIVFSANDTTLTGGGLFKEKAKELRFYMDTYI